MTTIQERLRYKGVEDKSISFKAGIALSIVGEAADIIDKLVEALNGTILQIEYLHDKFQETGSGNAELLRAREALKAAGVAKLNDQ